MDNESSNKKCNKKFYIYNDVYVGYFGYRIVRG